MAGSILFVCHANVCRSPLLAFSFTQGLPADLADLVDVSSVGIAATPGASICTFVRDLVSAEPDGEAFARDHRSVRAARTRVDRPQLIFTASAAERSALARMSPKTRTYTFTVGEALMLGEDLPSAVGSARGSLPWAYAEALASRRGMVPVRRTRLPWQRAGTRDLDIPDVHQYSDRKHARALPGIAQDGAELARRFTAFAGSAGSS